MTEIFKTYNLFVYKIHNMSNYSERLVLPYIITERRLTNHVFACLYVRVLHDKPVPSKFLTPLANNSPR